jgi:Uri superfamily endonuclease
VTGLIVPRNSGTYALILSCSTSSAVPIGRLGHLRLQPGCYVYVGSAFGLGGLAARVAHHIRVAPHPRWHIDYLRKHTHLEEVWYTCDPARREHEWAECFEGVRGAKVPLLHFGSSDCHCRSHLFRFATMPSVLGFQRRIATLGVDCLVVA